MSKMSELVEAEARAAESDDTDNGDGEPTEPTEPTEPEPNEPAKAKRELSAEAQMRAFERHMQAHERKLREIMGDDFDAFVQCDFCSGLGFRVGEPLKAHPERETCEYCGGYGQLTTGSLRTGHEAIDCERCGGSGSRVKTPEVPPTPVAAPPGFTFDPATGTYVPIQANAYAPPVQSEWAPGYVPQPGPVAPGNPTP